MVGGVPCTAGAGVQFPNGKRSGWSCPNRAAAAVKVDGKGLEAWTDTEIPVEYAPLCREHMMEVSGSIVDWLDIGEWKTL